ncbi:MAG: transposase [Acidithiobacillus sp.]
MSVFALNRLLTSSSAPVFLIVDGHAIHKAKLVGDFVAIQEGRLQLFYLPPYAPHPNPDELVWGHVKKQVSRQILQSQNDLKFLVLSALRRLRKLPYIVAGFFRHPTCRYAIRLWPYFL